MVKEIGYFSKVIETRFNKPLVLTEKYHEDFNNSNKCCAFKTSGEVVNQSGQGEVKVKDHKQSTGKY